MDYYKYWLIGNLENLDCDIINCIKKNIRVIKAPTFEEIKLGWKDDCYIHNQIVHLSRYDNIEFNNNLYEYESTSIWVENGKITDINFYYFMKDTLYDYSFYIDLEKSKIKNLTIYKYSNDDIIFLTNDLLSMSEKKVEKIDLNKPGIYDVKDIILID